MKNLITLIMLSFGLFSSPLFSQNVKLDEATLNPKKEISNTRHQIGVSLGNNRPITFEYRNKISPTTFFRANLNGGVAIGLSEPANFQFNSRLGFGIEKHIPLGKKLNFYYGTELANRLSYFREEINVLGFELLGLAGLKYQVNNKLAFFAEARYGLNLFSRSIGQGVDWNLNSISSARIGLLITLGKAKFKEKLKEY